MDNNENKLEKASCDSDAVESQETSEGAHLESSEPHSADTDGSSSIDTPELFPLVSQDIFSVIENEIRNSEAEERTAEEDEPEAEAVIDPDDTVLQEESATVSDDKSLYPKENNEPQRQRKKREVGKRAIDTVFDFVELFIFTLVAVLVVTTFIFRHSVVSGPSMMMTLEDGDKLIISNLFYEPEYMDIVVIEDYSCGMTSPIVKRVIATEGDTVKIAPEGIYVNGKFLDESEYVYTEGKHYTYILNSDPFKRNDTLVEVLGEYIEFVVPEDEVFLLGDHRNDSKDSRTYGTMREDAILGKVIFRLSPFTYFN